MNRNDASTLQMGDGKDRPRFIVDGDRVRKYVGIGWIDIRPATDEDRGRFPTLTEVSTRGRG